MSELPKVIVPPVVGFVTADHAVLFQESAEQRCDVCASVLGDASTKAEDEDGDDAGFDMRGRGLLVWSRGEERRYQEPPLCSACATAIGVSALQRWEIEEEEG